jgi:tryptophan-rich sensory protein
MTTFDDRIRDTEPGGKVASALVLVAFLAIAAAVAVLGSLATTAQVDGWYADAQKAPWTPPNALFGPAWTVLYTLMSVAAWLVWRERDRVPVGSALGWYVGQLALNSIWTPVFFALYPVIGTTALWIAFAVIVLLDAAVIVTIVRFWRIRRAAAALMIPYLAWILFASSLNLYAALAN